MSSSGNHHYRSQDFVPISLIGSGQSWDLIKARNRADGRIYRIKSVRLEPGWDVGKALKLIQTINELDHPAIVNIKYYWKGHQGKLVKGLRKGDTTGPTHPNN